MTSTPKLVFRRRMCTYTIHAEINFWELEKSGGVLKIQKGATHETDPTQAKT